MNALFDIWYGMSRRGRVFGWCAGVLCLTLTVTLSVGYPGWKTLHTQQTRLSQQREAARQQWRHLSRLSVAAEPLFGRTVENPRPFSPLDFQAPPLRLLHWQPSAQGGEMALKTSWDAVPSLFVRLAESEMSVSRFSLRKEGAELLMTLQLERLANEG
ncbi:hypothetical protein BTN65_02210 [Salmonella enterica subsp. enterica serovar Enteritidis]|uniref:DNA utilization protein HofO C-terminal domain-containing protein n=1 Tax=Salmonella enteritidis TaxID=149539 RepID=A0A5Y3L5R9_SALEN|nr:hypothetical protein [Salmonella enterica]ATS94822.1 hypothetical protein BTN65_02210 [Salmonella enterica subsp. enterica serovar Enteritidis]EAQ6293907.1 hypothetical protein [Salmonella enterica]EBS5616217.1 hypothetical protein [Salmonella enterica subsp. enterica serovar Enteritidis]ECA1407399.1 hypothetical protein [Salmonella enterica subsp. enterica serovar Enteritidis]ECI2604213.1 hypothetical protein [Salmonella enterica subsp. enterica serovar Enteritidis]